MNNNIVNYKVTSTEIKEIWPIEEVKNYLRVSNKNDDKLINDLINSAIDYAEQFLGTSFFIKKITCSLDSAPEYLRVKYIPIIKCTKILRIRNQIQDNITNDFGYIDFEHAKIWIAQKYWHNKLEIDYEAGWGENVPRTVIHGVLMHIGMMYDFGENSSDVLNEIQSMYLPYRRSRI